MVLGGSARKGFWACLLCFGWVASSFSFYSAPLCHEEGSFRGGEWALRWPKADGSYFCGLGSATERIRLSRNYRLPISLNRP